MAKNIFPMVNLLVLLALLLLPFVLSSILASPPNLKVNLAEFIFEQAPFAQCHASTIVELPSGDLLAAWFGGKREGDDSVQIWLSRKPTGGTWLSPEVVTNFPESPCWNPVLFRDTRDQIWLFFKVGPSPQTWVGAYRISIDEGQTWSDITYLPAGMLGPIRNKPIILTNGDILSGTSVEAGYGRGTPPDAPYRSWACWVERSSDAGQTWSVHGPITVPGENFGVIQPTLWESRPGVVKMLMRSTQRIGFICESMSSDGGKTWSPARRTQLPNPNSGIDAVRMRDGKISLVYNHTRRGRTPLNIAFSNDDGQTWSPPYVLEKEPGEYSYPAIIQTSDGRLHITYTWKRQRIKHVVVDPSNIP